MNNSIIICDRDADRLRKLVASGSAPTGADPESLRRLAEDLDRAKILPAQELPPDVVSMNRRVELEDLTDGEVLAYTLVFPENADASAGKISVLAPLGMAMLGYRVGDEFEWPVPAGTIRARVRRLLDPAESAHA